MPRPKGGFNRPAVPLKENDVQKAVCGFLRAQGWRIVRTQFSFVQGAMATGEPGMPDVIALYPLRKDYASVLGIWLEFKSPNAKLNCRCEVGKKCRLCRQKDWHERERARGFVVWSGVDDTQWFIDTYQSKFAWLHSGDQARGQLDLLAEAKS